eukprot:m.424600 g.424600  ORF g.424600 m.424600 type:complete len:730 (-) comp20215_c2_seq2:89-2278(-)
MGQQYSKWPASSLFKSFVGPLPVADGSLWDSLLDTDLAIPPDHDTTRKMYQALAPHLRDWATHDTTSGNLAALARLATSLIERLHSFPDLEGSDVARLTLRRARNALFVIRAVLWHLIHDAKHASIAEILTHCDPSEAGARHFRGTPTTLDRDVVAEYAFAHDNGDVGEEDSQFEQRWTMEMSLRQEGDITDARQSSLNSSPPSSPLNQQPQPPPPPSHVDQQAPPPMVKLLHQIAAAVALPIGPRATPVALEAVNLLITLASPVLFLRKGHGNNALINEIVSDSFCAHSIVGACLQHFMEARVIEARKGEMDGIVSDFLSIMSLPLQAYSYVFDDDKAGQGMPAGRICLTRQSVLALLALFFHRPEGSKRNLCRRHLALIEDAADVMSHSSPETIKISFAALYTAFCERMAEEETALLLYVLLAHSQSFSAYLLSRVGDFEQLMMPLLKALYACEPGDTGKAYIMLVILLMLSEDSDFNQCMQTAAVEEVPWFQERVLKQVTISDLIVLVLVRIAHRNLKALRDEFTHRTCLATLANMSPFFTDLHPFACQRLVGLYKMLAKHFLKAREEARHQEDVVGSAVFELGGVVGIVLAVINSCLANRLRHNPNLVYTLLVEKAEFLALRDHQRFAYEIENIDILLRHFESRLDWQSADNLSVETVLQVILEGARQLPDDRLKKLPPLRYAYTEGSDQGTFFLPYVWEQLLRRGGLLSLDALGTAPLPLFEDS